MKSERNLAQVRMSLVTHYTSHITFKTHQQIKKSTNQLFKQRLCPLFNGKYSLRFSIPKYYSLFQT
ncbi:MAG: hypothetical protein FD155_1958 [Bacteroidetes bacterium]|nr:MAG: hypothetical protein FD155_1958 [Bacteroidota bacterium]